MAPCEMVNNEVPTIITNVKKRRRLLLPAEDPAPKKNKIPDDYPPYFLTSAKLRAYVKLLKEPIIEAFHIHDVCCLSSDSYLLAIVFVYFVRADIKEEEYTVFKFFCALYLALEMEEEIDDYRWELLPWALGPEWQNYLRHFIREKNNIWRGMRYYGIVSRHACKQVVEQIKIKFSQEEIENCPVISRNRNATHSGVIKQTIRKNQNDTNTSNDSNNNLENSPATSYNPKGPVWHHGSIGDSNGPPCNICKQQLSVDIIRKHKELFENAKAEYANNIPIVLSQGLDVADSISDSDISIDSEDEWEPDVPNTNRLKFAGHTGRPKGTDKVKILSFSEEIQKEICIEAKDGSKAGGRTRKVLKDSSLSPLSDENTQLNVCYVKPQMPEIEELINENGDSPQCVFTQSDDDENDAEIMEPNKYERISQRKRRSNSNEDIFNHEYIHRLKLKQNLSQANLLDLLNNSIASQCF